MPRQMVQRGKHAVWYADCRHLGTRIRDCLSTTDRKLAERRLAELKHLVERGEYQSLRRSFDEFVSDYEREILSHKSETSKVRNLQIIQSHLLPFFGGWMRAEIGQEEAVEYKLLREKAGARPSTLKKELRVLKDILRLGDRTFELPRVADFPLMKWANRPKEFGRGMILDESDVLRIVDLVLEKYRPVCLIGIYSGLRLGDILTLCPKDVDLKGETMGKRQGKTGHWVDIPIRRKLRTVLRSLVWPLDKNQPFFQGFGSKAVTVAVRKACQKVGLEKHSFKSFRHFAATYLVNNGVSVEVVQQFMGHQDIKTTMIYAKVKSDTVRQAVLALDRAELSTKCPQAESSS